MLPEVFQSHVRIRIRNNFCNEEWKEKDVQKKVPVQATPSKKKKKKSEKGSGFKSLSPCSFLLPVLVAYKQCTMVAPSVDTRNHVLNLVTNVLTRPEKYGDRFFVQIVRGAKDGYVPITLLRSMVSDLNDIPAGYFQHCADKEPDRLELSIDRSKVRLPRQDDGTMDTQETDPYGYLTSSTSDDDNPTTVSSDNNPPTSSSSSSSSRFQPYSPSFSTGRSVLPVYFKDGKFYSDSEPDKEPHLDRPAMEVPPYDKLEIEPLGDDNG